MTTRITATPLLQCQTSDTAGGVSVNLRADTNTSYTWTDTSTSGDRGRYIYKAVLTVAQGASTTIDLLDGTLKDIGGTALVLSRVRSVFIRVETATAGSTLVNVTSTLEAFNCSSMKMYSGASVMHASSSNSYTTLTNATNETITFAVPSGTGSMTVYVIIAGD